jgi:Lon protease-like protein
VLDDLPAFPLSIVLLPGEIVPLHIFEPRYRELTSRCEERDEPFAIALEDGSGRRTVACTARIVEVTQRYADGRFDILVRGERPIRVLEWRSDESYLTVVAEELADSGPAASDDAQKRARAVFSELAEEAGAEADADETVPLSYAIAARVELPPDAKQSLLEDRDEGRRLATVTQLLEGVRRGLRIASEVQQRARRNGRVRSAAEIAPDLGID